ncbi:Outer membrane protein beta-barrel domain-containing protein [Sphingomonas antarctica]|uniref:outer membrane protein n=1 Tax=Sphingomonas antarctica TaxID=2040274 RepID=UPI0039ED3435
MRTIISAALVSTIALAAPAMAQDRAPFTGARAEAVVGYDRVQAGGGHEDGVTYGGQAGYDFQAGHFVAGIEGEATGSSTDACDGPGSVASPNLCVKAGRDLYAGGRIGAVVGGNTLLYAKAGYTNARVRLTSSDGTTTTTLGGKNLDGVRVGAGIEHKFGGNFYGKAEYRYSNYEQGVSRHGVLAGVGVRF